MKRAWGNLQNGLSAELFRITCPTGEFAEISSYGATLVGVHTFDKNGSLDNVILAYDTVTEYENNPKNVGATIGRYANRIAYGRFLLLNREIQVTCNRPPHSIHGGMEGFDKKLWDTVEEEDGLLRLRYISPDGEEGFPGRLIADAVFDFRQPHTLIIRYEAQTDKPTVCSMTNHAYWNLNGHASGKEGCAAHKITVSANFRTEQKEDGIPTGKLIPLEGTTFDLKGPVRVKDLIEAPELQKTRGIDHTYALSDNQNVPASHAEGELSGRTLDVYTNLPAMQVYLGGNLPDGLRGSGGAVYGKHSAFCMETQHFPDAPNHSEFPSPVLMPNETGIYETKLVFGIVS